jgi:uncharacterized protein (DUF2147 family)
MRTHVLIAIAYSIATGAPALAASPAGDWLVAEGTAVVRIAPCNNGWCGKLARTPGPGQDEHNPDPAKRGQPMLGTTILIDMKPNGTNRWDGEIYNPENGKTYTGHIVMLSPDALRIEGCLLGILCGGETWTRTSADPAAGSSATGASPPVRGPESAPRSR